MPDSQVRLYEGLFLLDQAATASDFGGTIDRLKEIFARADAEVLTLSRWDERKLAYEIEGQKRGIFILAYFNVKGPLIANIERDCELSDFVLRTLIIRADHVGEVELEQARRDADMAAQRALRGGGSEAEAPAEETEEETEEASA